MNTCTAQNGDVEPFLNDASMATFLAAFFTTMKICD